MLSFFKPTPRSLALFAVLAFIYVGGAIQSYAFIDDAVPKPPLYDLLKPLVLWLPWIFLVAPIHLLGSLLRLRWLLEYRGYAVLAYAYIISCWAAYSWDRWARYSRYGKFTPLVGIALSSHLWLPLIFSPAGNPLEYAARVVSGFAFLAVVFATYAVSIYGLYKALQLAAKIASHRRRRVEEAHEENSRA